MASKLKKFIPLFIVLLIICLSTVLYLNRDSIFNNNDIQEEKKNEEIDEPILEIEDNEDVDNPEDIVTDEEVKEDSVSDNKEETKKEEPSNKNDTTTSNKPNNNNSSSNNNNNNNNNNNDDTDENDASSMIPTLEELNNSYRNNIQNTYGIKIAYGAEMGDYLVGNCVPTKMIDHDDIKEYLGRIDSELKKYPLGFFKEIRDYGMPVTFYLVKDIPNSDIAGITNSQFYSNIVISIKEGLLFEKTLNHEIMHYIDAYLNSKMYPNTVETEWSKLNPVGFVYGVFDTNYDYFPSQNNNAYFFSSYSQTNYKEDRATLFGDIMTRSYNRPCYSNGYPLYNKLKLLSKQIDAGFSTVNSSTIEYWEKFL